MKNYLIILTAILIFTGKGFSQSVGAGYVRMFSENNELRAATGYNGFFSLPLTGKFEICFDYTHLQNKSIRFGFLSGGFMAYPPSGFEKHFISGRSVVNSYELFAALKLISSTISDLSLGLGISSTSYKTERTDMTTLKNAVFTDSHFGFMFGIFAEKDINLISGLGLFINVKLKTSGSSTEILDAEQPFKSVFLKGFQAGLKYNFAEY